VVVAVEAVADHHQPFIPLHDLVVVAEAVEQFQEWLWFQ
jgi:hypothetical protein